VFTPEEVVVFVREQMQKHGDAQKCCQVSGYAVAVFLIAELLNFALTVCQLLAGVPPVRVISCQLPLLFGYFAFI
jgi:hypothetical protein